MTKIVWQPSKDRIKNSNMQIFMDAIDKNIKDYESLHSWSTNNVSEFWGFLWKFLNIKSSKPFTTVLDNPENMVCSKWFNGAQLNFAENLLKFKDENIALISKKENKPVSKLSYKALYDEVARVAKSLKNAGIKDGDRVVGFMPNIPETVIAMLAATSLGAVWSSCSPDFGEKGVLDRFGQIKPRVLFTADGYFYKGKWFDSLSVVTNILKEIQTIEKIVVVPYTDAVPKIDHLVNSVLWDDFKSKEECLSIDFKQLPFDHPLYIMYSSGTTGLPKCMVHSAGGVLINQLKELVLHIDLKREDTIFYFTTCGWMMWNWLICSLGTGATIFLYDGNPIYPTAEILWEVADEENISVFGTSAGYIHGLQNSGFKPRTKFKLNSLKSLLSTGSPLSTEGFEFVYNDIKKDLQLSSISGGTDINGCFVLGNPILPVYLGQIQCRGLGMKVEVFNETGKSVIGEKGELVCTAPFPSMPVCFWNDPGGEKYNAAYFNVFPGVWRHGDYIEINTHGGVIIYGRSDSTLNPGGVRIGTAEIYRQVEQLTEVSDSLVIGQDWENDVRVILFVKLEVGYKLNDSLVKKIKETIRLNTTPRHVPAKILEVPDIPYTHNMKKIEIAVKKTIQNEPVLNRDAIRNPEVLDYFAIHIAPILNKLTSNKG